jgi:ketosteroid isomerase-like protein
MTAGGCLCGAVRYRAHGRPFAETHCHCTICRRASGAAFVTWASFERSGFEIVGETSELRATARAVRRFCPRCGTPLTFEFVAQPDRVDVTVASLDLPESITPRDHIYAATRLPWIALADGLPAFSEGRGSSSAATPSADHPNALRVRDLFRGFAAGDVAAIQAAIAEDAVWHFPGRRGQLAGSHRGHEAIFTFLGKVVALSEGSFHLDLVEVVANADRAVALFRGHGRRGDRELDNPTCLVVRLVQGRASEIWEYVWDLPSVDDFWA